MKHKTITASFTLDEGGNFEGHITSTNGKSIHANGNILLVEHDDMAFEAFASFLKTMEGKCPLDFNYHRNAVIK